MNEETAIKAAREKSHKNKGRLYYVVKSEESKSYFILPFPEDINDQLKFRDHVKEVVKNGRLNLISGGLK